MSSRVGLWPVVAVEWRMAARRWQGYALRSVAVLMLFGAMAPAWWESPVWPEEELTIAEQANAGKAAYERTLVLLLGLVGLAAPAATAGAICLDKARGNLALLLATELSDAGIVLGKLAARLIPVLGIIIAAAPLLLLETFLGGVDPAGIVGALLVVLTCAAFGCSLALTLSVWGRKTHEVLMATYAFGILYILAAPIWWGLRAMLPASWWWPWMPSFWEILRYNPVFLVLAAGGSSLPTAPVTLATQAGFFGLGLGASSLLIVAATWRIRAVVIRQLGEGDRPRRRRRGLGPGRLGRMVRRALPGPSLDGNPVLWRECRRRRPSRWDLAIRGLYVLICGGFSLLAIAEMRRGNALGRDLGVVINGLQVGGGLLLIAVSAATRLAEERVRGSLDVLMASPLSTREIVWGKWWGTFRTVPLLLILPLAVTTGLASFSGRYAGVPLMAALILAYGASMTSLGLALATWLPKGGHAAALSVAIYVTGSIAWFAFALTAFGDGLGSNGAGVAAGSPPGGVAIFSEALVLRGMQPAFASQSIWTLFWTVAHAGIAAALLLATIATFNRCLGRNEESSVAADVSRPRGPRLGAGSRAEYSP